jgi:hypothetical protein
VPVCALLCSDDTFERSPPLARRRIGSRVNGVWVGNVAGLASSGTVTSMCFMDGPNGPMITQRSGVKTRLKCSQEKGLT